MRRHGAAIAADGTIYYGGFTATHTPLPGNPAIDGGTGLGCPATDQRGVPRPNQAIPMRIYPAPGDVVELSLPMTLRSETRYNNSVSLLRGPLYFSLRIGKDYKLLKSYDFKGAADWAIHPTTPWNYGLAIDRAAPGRAAEVVRHNVGTLPFGDRGDKVFSSGEGRMTDYSEDAPVVLRVPAKKIAAWGMHKNSCADPPTSPVKAAGPTEMVELVPYGCTRLRITEFPVLVE
jgi:hypothetical protein